MKQHSLDFIIRQCQKESQQKRIDETGYCFEMFRRAIENEEDSAWRAIQEQYQGLVIQWLQRASKGTLLPDERQEVMQEAFIKFWTAMKKRPPPLSAHFKHIGALLSYLNQCVVTTCMDYHRRQQRRYHLQEKLRQEFELRPEDNLMLRPQELLEQCLDELRQTEQLQRVQAWMKEKVTNPEEKRLFRLIYEEGLKPAQIIELYPEEFPTYQYLHRIRVRVLKRAKRALAN